MTRFRCKHCPYVYDPRRGDPDGGILPGTPFSRIPESWRCPVCGARKSDFVALFEGPPPVSADAAAKDSSAQAQSQSLPPPRRNVWTVGSLKAKARSG